MQFHPISLVLEPLGLERRLRGRAGHDVPGHEEAADQGPGRLEPVRRQVKVAIAAHIPSNGTNWMAMMVESGTKDGSGNGLISFPVSHSVPYCRTKAR